MEEWKDILGYEGLYQISSFGRVKSLEREWIAGFNIKVKGQEKIRKISFGTKGYSQIQLFKNGKHKTCRVHRLVAEAFIPNPDNKSQVNHINGIKTDNIVENLEWCTNEYNMNHAWKNGLHKIRIGDKSPNNKLTSNQVIEMRAKFSTGNYLKSELANEYSISRTQACDILNRKSWRHI